MWLYVCVHVRVRVFACLPVCVSPHAFLLYYQCVLFLVCTVLTKNIEQNKFPKNNKRKKKERNILRFIKISSGTVISETDCDCVTECLAVCVCVCDYDCIHFVASVDLLVI